ncbi:diacylglycerol kinase family lipid kinase [Bacillaceae bacterium Marseille-Q3522]|nr:diacylglycerol kinase family lipid kinase [Bacillaceae bacterium Marseille-Q3522]
MKKWYFIINPQAKNGYSLIIWRKLEKVLQQYKINYIAFFTEYKGHGKELARTIAKKTIGQDAVIIAVGGDGSIHDIINGAVGYSHLSIGFIPAGSGNDFARGYSISKNPLKALEQQVLLPDEEKCIIDIGKMIAADGSEIVFVNNMGVGFDALICNKVNKSSMKKWFNRFRLGTLIYAYMLVKHLFTYRPQPMKITVDGTVHLFSATWFVTVSNQPYYGGGMKIAPNASPMDGMLNIIVVHNLSRIKLLLIFMTVFWGKHTSFKEVTNLTGHSIKMEGDIPIEAHADGEYAGHTPFVVQINKCSLALTVDRREQIYPHSDQTKLNK